MEKLPETIIYTSPTSHFLCLVDLVSAKTTEQKSVHSTSELGHHRDFFFL